MSQMMDSAAPYTTAIQRVVMLVRIITAAMLMGILAFAGVALSSAPRAAPAAAEAPADAPAAAQQNAPLGPLTMMAVALMVGTGTAATVMPRMISRSQVAQLKAKHGAVRSVESVGENETYLAGLLRVFQTQHIVRLALLEGPAFLGLIAYMTERHAAVLVVPAVSIALMLLTFPSFGNVVRWLERVVVDDPTS